MYHDAPRTCENYTKHEPMHLFGTLYFNPPSAMAFLGTRAYRPATSCRQQNNVDNYIQNNRMPLKNDIKAATFSRKPASIHYLL